MLGACSLNTKSSRGTEQVQGCPAAVCINMDSLSGYDLPVNTLVVKRGTPKPGMAHICDLSSGGRQGWYI